MYNFLRKKYLKHLKQIEDFMVSPPHLLPNFQTNLPNNIITRVQFIFWNIHKSTAPEILIYIKTELCDYPAR